MDDLLLTGSSPETIIAYKKELGLQYKMRDLGIVQRYLGIEFTHSIAGIFLHQSLYVNYLFGRTWDARQQTRLRSFSPRDGPDYRHGFTPV